MRQGTRPRGSRPSSPAGRSSPTPTTTTANGASAARSSSTQGRGLSFALRPSWGAEASAAERLLSGEPLADLATNDNGDNAARGRLRAELGYGLPAFGGRFTATPHAGFTLGWRLDLARSGPVSFDLGLEATRREAANDDGAEVDHTVGVKLRAAW